MLSWIVGRQSRQLVDVRSAPGELPIVGSEISVLSGIEETALTRFGVFQQRLSLAHLQLDLAGMTDPDTGCDLLIQLVVFVTVRVRRPAMARSIPKPPTTLKRFKSGLH